MKLDREYRTLARMAGAVFLGFSLIIIGYAGATQVLRHWLVFWLCLGLGLGVIGVGILTEDT